MRRHNETDTENKEPERDEMGAEVEREIDDDEDLDDDEFDDEQTEEREPQRGEVEQGEKGREGNAAETDDRVAWRPDDEEPDGADNRR